MLEHSTNNNKLQPVTVEGTKCLKCALGHVTPVTFQCICHLQNFDGKANQ